MVATNQPFGLKPVYHGGGGEVRAINMSGVIQSGYAASLGKFTPIKIDITTGYIIAGTTTGGILGVFDGCRYRPTGSSIYIETSYWVASTSYVAGTMQVWAFIDQAIVYEIQANGSLAQTSLGQQANMVNPGTVNALGFSTATISTTLVGTGTAGQLRIIDLAPRPGNAWGDAYTVVQVQIASQQYTAVANTLA